MRQPGTREVRCVVSILATGSSGYGEGSHTQVLVLVHRTTCGGMPEEVAFPVCRMPVKDTRATERAGDIIQGQGRHLDDIPALGHGDMWNNWTGLVSLMEIKLVRNDMRPHQSQNFINTAQRPQQSSLSNVCFPSMIGNSPFWSFYLVMTVCFPVWFCWTARGSTHCREGWQARALLASGARGIAFPHESEEYGPRLFLLWVWSQTHGPLNFASTY